jgi:hypothetical protein
MEGKQDHLLEDAMIAATERIHGLIGATRNGAKFAELDVPAVTVPRRRLMGASLETTRTAGD